jgi:hypothetical protein
MNENMPCRTSREVSGLPNSLENLKTQRQLSMPEVPPRTCSAYFASPFCLLRIISSLIVRHRIIHFAINTPIMSVLCQFYVSFMSVLCQYNVYFWFYNQLVTNTLNT